MKKVFRRRREGVTDYLKRKNLLKSNIPRVVFRKTNRYLISQYVTSSESHDKVEIGITSKNLEKYGWPKESAGSLKSISASYLTGFLMGREILKKKKQVPIFDMGRISPVHKTKQFAFIKGIADAGVDISFNESVLPESERISGKHMKKDFSSEFEKIKSNIEKDK